MRPPHPHTHTHTLGERERETAGHKRHVTAHIHTQSRTQCSTGSPNHLKLPRLTLFFFLWTGSFLRGSKGFVTKGKERYIVSARRRSSHSAFLHQNTAREYITATAQRRHTHVTYSYTRQLARTTTKYNTIKYTKNFTKYRHFFFLASTYFFFVCLNYRSRKWCHRETPFQEHPQRVKNASI